jgi:Endonuclease/Exonuclease/phosphatase family
MVSGINRPRLRTQTDATTGAPTGAPAPAGPQNHSGPTPALEDTAADLGRRWSEFAAFTSTAPLPGLLSPKGKNEVIGVHWSTENLFDSEDDPATKDEDFLPSTGNTPAQVERHLANTAKALTLTDTAGNPLELDWVSVTEIENAGMAKRLGDKLTPSGLRNVVHFESKDERGIDQAIFTRLPVVGKAYHNFPVPSGDPTRGVLQADLDRGGGKIVTLLVLHAPSMRGGEAALRDRTEIFRQTRALRDALLQLDPSRQVIVQGDFNENPGGEASTAGYGATLSPTEAVHLNKPFAPWAMRLAQKGKNSDVRPDGKDEVWTHDFKGGKSLLDGELLDASFLPGRSRPGQLQLQAGWPQVLRLPFLLKGNVPDRFFGRDGQPEGNYSDHLPKMTRYGVTP